MTKSPSKPFRAMTSNKSIVENSLLIAGKSEALFTGDQRHMVTLFFVRLPQIAAVANLGHAIQPNSRAQSSCFIKGFAERIYGSGILRQVYTCED